MIHISTYFLPFLLIVKVNSFRNKYPGVLESWRSTEEGIQLYAEITNDIRKAVLKLEAEAWGRNKIPALKTSFS